MRSTIPGRCKGSGIRAVRAHSRRIRRLLTKTSRMRTLTLALKSTVESRASAADLLKSPGDAVLIQRGQPRWLILKCPCGCGDEIPVNLDRRAGKAWRFYGDAKSQ